MPPKKAKSSALGPDLVLPIAGHRADQKSRRRRAGGGEQSSMRRRPKLRAGRARLVIKWTMPAMIP